MVNVLLKETHKRTQEIFGGDIVSAVTVVMISQVYAYVFSRIA